MAIALAEGTEQDMAAELLLNQCHPRNPPPASPHPHAKCMRMSHVYQPLMLMQLLGHGFARQQPARTRREMGQPS
jgi:hypothetical protein